MPDILVIADQNDSLACALVEYGLKREIDIERAGLDSAVQKLSVTREGDVVTVEPQCALFLRPTYVSTDNRIARFHEDEKRSLLWAAAALTTAPVINRPTVLGLAGPSWLSMAHLRRRAGLPCDRYETFSSDVDPAGPLDEWWVEDYTTRQVSPARELLSSRGPFRGGQLPRAISVRWVTVVLSEASISGPCEPSTATAIRTGSLQICQSLGLQFASIPWWWSADSVPEPGRPLVYPHLSHVGENWDKVADNIVRGLGC